VRDGAFVIRGENHIVFSYGDGSGAIGEAARETPTRDNGFLTFGSTEIGGEKSIPLVSTPQLKMHLGKKRVTAGRRRGLCQRQKDEESFLRRRKNRLTIENGKTGNGTPRENGPARQARERNQLR